MLRELSVQNLALIEDVRVELEGGYCAWTGETGAGKSLLLTALALVLGGKASAEMIRTGKTEARAAAVFDLDEPSLKAEIESTLGGELDDGALIITRRISAQGRGSAHVNGLPVTISTLEKLGEILVDIHGQLEDGRCLTHRDSATCWTHTAGSAGNSRPTPELGRNTRPCAGRDKLCLRPSSRGSVSGRFGIRTRRARGGRPQTRRI